MRKRRHGAVLFAVACLCALAIRGRASVPEGAGPPDVLFIAVDDLNDWVGCLGGHPQARTPNIDRLAGRGVLFTRAYCAASACNPSRAALLTGIRPSTSGVYDNGQPRRSAMPEAVTLPQLFMRAGYHVAGAGKVFHGDHEPGSWHEYLERGPDPSPGVVPANGIPGGREFDWGPLEEPDEAMDDFRVVSWAIDQLNRPRDRPLFLACGIFRPHLPWYVPREYFDLFPLERVVLPEIRDDDLADVPAAGRQIADPEGDHRRVVESNNYRRAVQGYLASIAFADAQVGRLLDALERSPRARETIVVLWGDHGWHLGQKLHWRKFALWEEATRTPVMVVAPGVTPAGARCDRVVSLLDLYPTLADLCGLPMESHPEGVSLRPLLQDPSATWEGVAVTTHGPGNHAVRSERWRYIRYAGGAEELYDHDNDPREWTNLALDPRLEEVKERLARWLPAVNAPPAPQGSAPPQDAGP